MGTASCFVCGPQNPFGLHIAFMRDGDDAVATYQCEARHAGWPGVQHGGITAALLDEAAGYVPQFMGVLAMTARLDVSYHHPILVGDLLTIRGRPTTVSKRIIVVESTITNESGRTLASSQAKMRILTEDQRHIVQG